MNCIPKKYATILLSKIADGTLDPHKMKDWSDTKRREFFQSFTDEKTAREMNALFESKLLMKNQEQGFASWGMAVLGVKSKSGRDFLSRVKRLDKVLTPPEREKFMSDLVAQRLGTEVTPEQASELSILANEIDTAKANLDKSDTTENRMKYGYAQHNFLSYVQDLKMRKGITWMRVLETPRSLKASFDNSFNLRQNLLMAMTHPTVWASTAGKSFKVMYDTLGGKQAMAEIMANLLSRDNAINGKYKLSGLDIGVTEEAFPTSLPEEIPILYLGRMFRASQDAYTAAAYWARAELFDLLVKQADNAGIDVNDEFQLKSIARLVNSMTGRGVTGQKDETNRFVNAVFFSPKNVMASIDILTAGQLSKVRVGKDKVKISKFAQKQAAYNLLKMVSFTALLLWLLSKLGLDVETDPTSADFGTAKVGNTRFDFTAGRKALVVLAARMISYKLKGTQKSSITGIKRKLNTGKWGDVEPIDMIISFLGNKLSPNMQFLRMVGEQKDWEGRPLTVGRMVMDMLIPLIISNQIDASQDDKHANLLVMGIAEFMGINTNTYGLKDDWTASPNEHQKQLKEQVTPEQFKQANKDFNTEYVKWFDNFRGSDKWLRMDDTERQAELNSTKQDIENKIYRKYRLRFKPKRSK
jgi:hypothetical protein